MSKFRPHWNEEPLTKVCDAYTEMCVSVSKIEGLSIELGRFIECGYLNRPSYTLEIPDMQMLVDGGALGHALECLNVNVAISGVSRIFTHQLVRQRIGITFSQQCSGEVDWRHANVLIPRACKNYYREIVDNSLAAKMGYAEMLDSKRISLQEARYVLPHTLGTHIYFKCSLAVIFALYGKRSCTMSNCWEMILFCEKMKAQLIHDYPMLDHMFRENCFFEHCRPEYGIVFPWVTDERHRGLTNTDPIYQSTHEMMSCVNDKPITTSYYQGYEEIAPDTYLELEEKYVNNS